MSHNTTYCQTFDRLFIIGDSHHDAIKCKVKDLDTSTLHNPRLIVEIEGYIWSLPFDRCVLVKEKEGGR